MKKFMIYSLITGLFAMAACKNKGGSGAESGSSDARKERVAHNTALYENALNIHDNYMQLSALSNLAIDDSANNKKYLDSLVLIYQRLSMYTTLDKIIDKAIAKDPENEKVLEIKAVLDMEHHKFEDALQLDRKLYDKTNKLKYLFNLASAQMQMDNTKAAEETFTKIKTSPTYQKDSIDIVDDRTGHGVQMVPAPAAMAYVEAMIAASKRDYPTMEAKLKQALNIYPNFNNANYYMQAIAQSRQQGAPGPRPKK